MTDAKGGQARAGRFLGSLKDALVAASRDDTHPASPPAPPAASLQLPAPGASASELPHDAPAAADIPSAEEAARHARAAAKPLDDRHVEMDSPPTTRVVRSPTRAAAPEPDDDPTAPARTQLVRGKQRVERGGFTHDPVVGWLVVVGGPGIGQYRPVFEGNNTIGRSDKNRVAIDFGDDAISSEEQAYIRYDSSDRSFLFVPNLAKTNVVSVNSKRPTAAVELAQMDVITMGRTQLVFVPFCGPEFDWAALAEVKV